MRITQLGHACLLVEDGGSRLLLDPGVLTPGADEQSGLDAVLVTHAHPDHVDGERLPLLLEGNGDAKLITEPATAAELGRAGLDAAALHPGESTEVAGFTVHALGGLHAVIHQEVPRVGNVGLLLVAPSGATLYHPGDALDAVPPAGLLPSGTLDVLALPVGGPWLAIGPAIDFARAVAARAVVPIHDGALSAFGRGIAKTWLTNLLPAAPVDASEGVDLG